MNVECQEMNEKQVDEATVVAREAARLQAGVTLIEIMIVLAIIALIMGLLVGPAVINNLEKAKVDTAYQKTKQIEAAYSRWQVNAEGNCPSSIDDLKEQLGIRKTEEVKDPWGSPYILKCGDNAPEECEGFCVVSLGKDKKENTEDDIKSWMKPKRD